MSGNGRSIRWGKLKGPSDDKGPYKLHTIETDGKEMDIHIIEPYGIQGNAIKDSMVLVFVPDGDEGKAVGIALPPPAKRVEGQKDGEVQLKNHATGNEIKHEAGGDTIIKTAGIFHVNPA